MKRTLIIAAVVLVLGAGAFVAAKREPLMLGYLAGKTQKASLADHQAFLAPHIEFRAPETGAPPYPAVIQFHGCSGHQPSLANQWADLINAAGYMAIIVDSHAPRGISRDEAFETVCTGQQLIAQERAGDVVATFEMAKAREDVDAETIILAGWSHGAWTIMDFMTMNMKDKRPASIEAAAMEAPQPAGLILFYPYCGLGAHSRFDAWTASVPALSFIAGKDTIVSPDECLKVFEKLKDEGTPVTAHVYPDADHVFDFAGIEEEYKHMYNAGYAADAAQRVSAYLDAQK